MAISVIILAAGRGVRAGGAVPKQYRTVGGKAALRRAIEAFLALDPAPRIQVVYNPADAELYERATAGLDLPEAVQGGASRQESVLKGLRALKAANPGIVLIHDSARCFVRPRIIRDVIARVRETGAGVIPALPVTDTLKAGDGKAIGKTVPREGLYRAQTPQGFPYPAILAAHEAQAGENLTDDAAVFEAAGHAVHMVEGAEENIKMTTEEDFTRAEAALSTTLTPRVGKGFDVHRFGPGDHVWLNGVKIAHEAGLIGHSDADAGLHAITDAILGAIGAGDIGDHFPPTDPQWKGAASDAFLAHAAKLVSARGGRIAHVDVTLICEAPKIGPHKAAMKARIAEILPLPASAVSVKATTTEKLGFTGRGEGLAAEAVATVLLPPAPAGDMGEKA